MTVEGALGWLRDHGEELVESIRAGKYKPQAVRRKEIPKGDGGVRKLGISTVMDCIIQQAITQQLSPTYEPLFWQGSVDLSKYFDTLNHEFLMNMVEVGSSINGEPPPPRFSVPRQIWAADAPSGPPPQFDLAAYGSPRSHLRADNPTNPLKTAHSSSSAFIRS